MNLTSNLYSLNFEVSRSNNLSPKYFVQLVYNYSDSEGVLVIGPLSEPTTGSSIFASPFSAVYISVGGTL